MISAARDGGRPSRAGVSGQKIQSAFCEGFQSFQGDEFGFTGAEGYEGDGEHSVLLLIRLEIKRNFGDAKVGK